MTAKHGYWKIYGHSATCALCGFCGDNRGDNYCMKCGAIMDEDPMFEIPEFTLPKLVHLKCNCGCERIVGDDGGTWFCPQCGRKLLREDEKEE